MSGENWSQMFSQIGNSTPQSMWSRMLPGLQQTMPGIGMNMMQMGAHQNPISMNMGGQGMGMGGMGMGGMGMYHPNPLSMMGQQYQNQWANYRPQMPPQVPGTPAPVTPPPAPAASQPPMASGGYTGPGGMQIDPLQIGYFPGAYR